VTVPTRTTPYLYAVAEIMLGGLLQGQRMSLCPRRSIVATPTALDILSEAQTARWELLARHQNGDWGNVPPEDDRENRRRLKYGWRDVECTRWMLISWLTGDSNSHTAPA
jgi:hypothetical protein